MRSHQQGVQTVLQTVPCAGGESRHVERKAQELCSTAAQSGFMQVGFNTKIRGVWGFMASNCLYWDFIVTLFYKSICTHPLEVTRTPLQPGPLHSQRSTCGPFALTSSEGRRHPAVKGPCRRHLRLLLRVSGMVGVHRGYTGLCPYACHTEPSRLPQANRPRRILWGSLPRSRPLQEGPQQGYRWQGSMWAGCKVSKHTPWAHDVLAP